MNPYLKVSTLSFVLFLLSTFHAFSQASFIEHNITNSFSGTRSVYARDLNGDGFIDIVGGGSNKICWWENDGNQNFTEHTIIENSGIIRSVWAEDLNGDGKADILAAAWTNNQVEWWENMGNENFTQHIVDSSFKGAHTVEANDVNQDGFMDILCSGFDLNNQSEIAWWENNGNAEFTKHLISERFKRSPFIHGNDIDHDGDIDILACGETNGEVLWWENDGNENFAERMIDINYTAAHTVFARDLDLDGDMDILGAACLSSQFTWWENDGNQNFAKHPLTTIVGALWIDASDLDRDGDNDLIGTGADGAFWWENDGNQNFTRHEIEGDFRDGYCLIYVDMDSDTDFDLISAGRGCNKITWWENTLYNLGFEANQTSGHAPLTIQFFDQSRPALPITSWKWDFDNDGTIDSQEQNPQWTYENPGQYTITLEVIGDSISKKITYKDYIYVFDGESALLFDGMDSYVTCPAAPSLNLIEKLSVEAWIKPSGWGENPTLGFGRICDKLKIALFLINTSPTFNNHSLALQLSYADGSSSISMTEENSINLDQWQHIAVTYNGTANQLKMFINGIERTVSHTKSPSGAVADNNSNDLIVGSNAGAGFTFDGLIDELRIWNIVRTPEEILENKDKHFMKTTPGLVGCYGMNEGCGEVIGDISGNENDGTIINALWRQGLSLIPTLIKKTEDNNQIKDFRLCQNYPNPFNAETKIKFTLPEVTQVSIKIYTITGKLVRTLMNCEKETGSYAVIWKGDDDNSKKVSSGLYFYKIETDKFCQTKKMLLVQ